MEHCGGEFVGNTVEIVDIHLSKKMSEHDFLCALIGNDLELISNENGCMKAKPE